MYEQLGWSKHSDRSRIRIERVRVAKHSLFVGAMSARSSSGTVQVAHQLLKSASEHVNAQASDLFMK
jgi:Flp pilus assembly CpaE family ATPase